MKNLIIYVLLLVGASTNLNAKVHVKIPIPWGTKQKIHEVQRIGYDALGSSSLFLSDKNPEYDKNSPLYDSYLGYVTEKTYFLYIFGMYIKNKGYAIGKGQDTENQGILIDSDVLEQLKSSQLISSSIPEEPSLSVLDVLEGFSFWWMLLAIVLLIKYRKKYS